jgi:hypothetical protein
MEIYRQQCDLLDRPIVTSALEKVGIGCGRSLLDLDRADDNDNS